MAEPGVEGFNEIGERWADELSAAVSNWYRFSDRGANSWTVMMRGVLEGPLVRFLRDNYAAVLTERGIVVISEMRIRTIVRDALGDTDDLRRRVLDAPELERPGPGLTAAFFIDTLISRIHQLGIVKSITRRVTDAFEFASVLGTEGYTGRRRWRTSVSDSRHRHLNLVEKGEGELFDVAEGAQWLAPRQDIGFAAQSSGCRCYLQYQFRTSSGRLVWR